VLFTSVGVRFCQFAVLVANFALCPMGLLCVGVTIVVGMQRTIGEGTSVLSQVEFSASKSMLWLAGSVRMCLPNEKREEGVQFQY